MANFDGFIPWRKSEEKEDNFSGSSNGKNDLGNNFIFGGNLFLKPYLYNVIITNEGNPPSEFINCVVQDFFHKSNADLEVIAKDLAAEGKGILGTYTREVAEMKMDEIVRFAKENNYTVQCIMEKDSRHAF